VTQKPPSSGSQSLGQSLVDLLLDGDGNEILTKNGLVVTPVKDKSLSQSYNYSPIVCSQRIDSEPNDEKMVVSNGTNKLKGFRTFETKPEELFADEDANQEAKEPENKAKTFQTFSADPGLLFEEDSLSNDKVHARPSVDEKNDGFRRFSFDPRLLFEDEVDEDMEEEKKVRTLGQESNINR